jgi:multicomponent Na+:H+ antiporter subunit A
VTVLALAILIVTAALAPGLCRLSRRFGTLLVAAAPAALGVWFASSFNGIASGTPLDQSWTWLPDLGLDLAFRVDGLSLTFALLICFIGSGVLLYASSYLKESPRLGSFLAILTSFMAAMLGLVLSNNLILLFVFWELTSITSFLLIGFEHERESARKAAVQALLTTGLGGLSLLAGAILIGLEAGTWTISDIAPETILQSDLYIPIAVLLLLGAFTKSAVFPFHYWLPNAMEAPSPVSALLHSATMVKAGVYLVARMHPTMSADGDGFAVWDDTLILFGGFTMLFAAFVATRQDQLKKILAYSTVSSLGTLIMLLGIGDAKAASTYLLAHAIFKGGLFLVAGSLTKATGTKYPEQLGGLLSKSPMLAGAAVLGGLSMAGMFPFIGFAGKELLLKAGLHHDEWSLAATIAATLAGTLTVYAALVVGIRPFLLKPAEGVKVVWKASPGWRQLFLPTVLAVAGLVAGLAPMLFAEPVVGMMVASIDPSKAGKEIHIRWLELLWPPTTATYLSIAAIVVGTTLFFGRTLYRAAVNIVAPLDNLGPARGYDVALSGMNAFAAGHTRIVQNGSLQMYVRVMLLTVSAVIGAALARTYDWAVFGELVEPVSALEGMLILSMVATTIGAILQRKALATVSCLSGVGFVIAILFALYGAPDLAMTQFAVETLLLIIFVLVIFHLPKYRDLSSNRSRLFDIVLALGFGVVIAGFLVTVLANPYADSIAEYHAANSLSEGLRPQHRQRHPRRLPRPRHARRDLRHRQSPRSVCTRCCGCRSPCRRTKQVSSTGEPGGRT